MKRKLSMGSLLIAGALTGFTGQAGASAQSNPDGGTGEISQQKSQQGVGLEGASSSSVILGGPEILLGRIEKIEHNGFLVRGDRGQSVKLQLTKDTNIVCSMFEWIRSETDDGATGHAGTGRNRPFLQPLKTRSSGMIRAALTTISIS